MKEKIVHYLQMLRMGFVEVLRAHPVELALIVYACVGCLVASEMDWPHKFGMHLLLTPLFAALALVVGTLAGHSAWRKLYWVCWLPIVPLSLWGGLEEWIVGVPYVITLTVLAPLAMLMCRRVVDNRRFIGDAIIYLRSAALALLFVNVALGLFCAIFYSTVYIFGLNGSWMTHVMTYVLILTQTLAVPVLFLILLDYWQGAECRSNRIFEVLLNYIVTPALLIYVVILYLYIAKIMGTWSLPRGGVAYMVFGFMLLAIGVQALQPLLDKRIYDRFFNRFSLISLPPLLLFWVGVWRRIDEYGLTQWRVYLVVCGGVMTVCMLLLLSKRIGRYLYVCLVAFVCFAAITYVPALEPERIAVRSQDHRAVRIAEQVGMLGGDGKLVLQPLVPADSVHREAYRQLYVALDYIEHRDSVAFSRFGLENMKTFEQIIPSDFSSYVISGFEFDSDAEKSNLNFDINGSSGCRTAGIGGYQTLYTNFQPWSDDSTSSYLFSEDTLRINLYQAFPKFEISGAELLKRQLRKVGIEEKLPEERVLKAVKDEFLTYADDNIMIIFSSMAIERDSILRLKSVQISAVMTR